MAEKKGKKSFVLLRCIAKGAWGLSGLLLGMGLGLHPGLVVVSYQSVDLFSYTTTPLHSGFSQDKHGMALQAADLGAYANGTGVQRGAMGMALFCLHFLFCILSLVS